MGEPVVVKEKPSSYPGVVRFETDRILTGMDHERYLLGDDVWGERPPDVLARRILARGGVDGVQVHGNIITVNLQKGHDSDGLAGIIENMYVTYPENRVGSDESTSTEAPVADAAAKVEVEDAPAESVTAESEPDA